MIGGLFLVANLVTTSKAPVTTSVALVPSSFYCLFRTFVDFFGSSSMDSELTVHHDCKKAAGLISGIYRFARFATSDEMHPCISMPFFTQAFGRKTGCAVLLTLDQKRRRDQQCAVFVSSP